MASPSVNVINWGRITISFFWVLFWWRAYLIVPPPFEKLPLLADSQNRTCPHSQVIKMIRLDFVNLHKYQIKVNAITSFIYNKNAPCILKAWFGNSFLVWISMYMVSSLFMLEKTTTPKHKQSNKKMKRQIKQRTHDYEIKMCTRTSSDTIACSSTWLTMLPYPK